MILVTGINGFLGARMARFFSLKYDVKGLSRKDMDFTNSDHVKKIFEKYRPDIVIHCAAVSDIDACEADPQLSYLVNVTGTKYIASACREYGARLIFCSSDQVYAGSEETGSHREDELVKPPHHYGRQKLEAEQICLEENRESICLRLSWMYDWERLQEKEHGNLMTSIMEAVRDKKDLYFPACDFRSITDAKEVVRLTETVFAAPPGVYNFGSPGRRSTYETASLILGEMNSKEIRILPREEETNRERNLMMDMAKAEAAKIYFPNVDAGVRGSILQMKKAGGWTGGF